MTQKGFVFLMVVGVLASLAIGKLVEPYTARGLERTAAFGACLAVVLYLAGRFAERRGWISGTLDLSKRNRPPEQPGAPQSPGRDTKPGSAE